MQRKHWKRAFAATLTGLATAAWGTPMLLGQTGESALNVPAGLQNMSAAAAGPIQYLPFAHFNIPFEVDRSGPVPREVNLWVSPDQGRSWLKYASSTPDRRSFEFHAAAEGEYLFAVQTRDDQGDSALAAAPPMRILIDTTQPELQLSVDVGPAGQLVIDYQISDAFLSADSVQLAYSADGLSQWEEVRIGSLGQNGHSWAGRTEISMPRCRELDVRITASDLAQNKAEKVFRFSAPRTAAANAGMQLASQRGDSRAIDPNAWTSAPPSQPLHSAQRFPQSNASGSAQTPGNRPPALNNRYSPTRLAGPMQPSAAQPITGQPTTVLPNVRQANAAQPSPGLAASQGAVPWNPSDIASSRSAFGWTPEPVLPAARPVAVQPGLNASVVTGRPAKPDNAARLAAAPSLGYEELPPPTPVQESSRDAALDNQLKLSDSASGDSASGDSASGSSAVSGNSADRQLPVARRELSNIELDGAGASSKAAPPLDAAPSLNIDRPADAPAPRAQAASPLADSGLSADASISASVSPASKNDPYHSRSRAFSLDYAVDSLRGAAVSDIELWGTEDKGRTWQKWGSDPDRQSPFDVQVGNDGLFGFRMVVIGSNGLISNRPESGDPADMWINVDTQMPSVSITRALYGEGEQAGSLVIEFSGNDDNMHDRPVTLSYSERPSGPWATITSGLAANGQYVWKPDSSLPRQVFLRAQAVDRAGNIHEHRLDLPVNLRGMAPQGRIQGFRPITQ